MPPEKRDVISPHSTETSDGEWDGAGEVSEIPNDSGQETLEAMFSWRDPDEDPDTKQAYKLPHHEVNDGEPGAANLQANLSAIAALNGARGGVDIPDADRGPVWEHHAQHIRDAGEEPPELEETNNNSEDEKGRSEIIDTPAVHTRNKGDDEPERRFFGAEIRQAEDDRIEGHAAVFDEVTDLGTHLEVVRSTAFDEALSNDPDVRMLWNHDSSMVFGRTKAGTLSLSKTSKGLKVENDPPDAQWARDAMTTMARGDVDQMSFGFRVPPGGDNWTEMDGRDLRELLRVKPFDVSPVTFPAYTGTDVGIREQLEAMSVAERRDLLDQVNSSTEGGGEELEKRIAKHRLSRSKTNRLLD